MEECTENAILKEECATAEGSPEEGAAEKAPETEEESSDALLAEFEQMLAEQPLADDFADEFAEEPEAEVKVYPPNLAKDRPLTDETEFLVRLWYLGEYRGAVALKKLTVRMIAKILDRREKVIRAALGEYYRK